MRVGGGERRESTQGWPAGRSARGHAHTEPVEGRVTDAESSACRSDSERTAADAAAPPPPLREWSVSRRCAAATASCARAVFRRRLRRRLTRVASSAAELASEPKPRGRLWCVGWRRTFSFQIAARKKLFLEQRLTKTCGRTEMGTYLRRVRPFRVSLGPLSHHCAEISQPELRAGIARRTTCFRPHLHCLRLLAPPLAVLGVPHRAGPPRRRARARPRARRRAGVRRARPAGHFLGQSELRRAGPVGFGVGVGEARGAVGERALQLVGAPPPASDGAASHSSLTARDVVLAREPRVLYLPSRASARRSAPRAHRASRSAAVPVTWDWSSSADARYAVSSAFTAASSRCCSAPASPP